MKKIVVATNNKGKIKEIRNILKEFELVTLQDVNCNIEVDENQETFEGNSLKKAKEISELVKMPCIADDSGLCIDTFNGWPGVYTARFLGEDATPEERNYAILEKMKNLDDDQRTAKVICVVTYYEDGKVLVGKGVVEGKISKEPRGNNGFGFDSIFELKDGNTFAQLDESEKNAISHRKKALENLKKQLTYM